MRNPAGDSMQSGSSCRMGRRIRPRECEISCYRHGCDPPTQVGSPHNSTKGFFHQYPASTLRLNPISKQRFFQSFRERLRELSHLFHDVGAPYRILDPPFPSCTAFASSERSPLKSQRSRASPALRAPPTKREI